jgi:hypothetical protein
MEHAAKMKFTEVNFIHLYMLIDNRGKFFLEKISIPFTKRRLIKTPLVILRSLLLIALFQVGNITLFAYFFIVLFVYY